MVVHCIRTNIVPSRLRWGISELLWQSSCNTLCENSRNFASGIGETNRKCIWVCWPNSNCFSLNSTSLFSSFPFSHFVSPFIFLLSGKNCGIFWLGSRCKAKRLPRRCCYKGLETRNRRYVGCRSEFCLHCCTHFGIPESWRKPCFTGTVDRNFYICNLKSINILVSSILLEISWQSL